MTKTAKITAVHQAKEFKGANGTTYYHNLTLDNGDEINIGKKKVMQVGDSITYELTGGDDGQQRFKKAKSAQADRPFNSGSFNAPANSQANDERQIMIVRQSSLKASIDLWGHHRAPSPKEVIEVAEIFTDWVMNGKVPADSPSKSNDDLPF